MSEVAVAEQPAPDLDVSAADGPLFSDDDLRAISELERAEERGEVDGLGIAAEGEESVQEPEQAPEPEPTPAPEPTTYDFDTLQQRLNQRQPLTDDELSWLGREQQSRRDQAQAQQLARQRAQAQRDKLVQLGNDLPKKVQERVFDVLGVIPDPDDKEQQLLDVRLREVIGETFRQAEAITHQAPANLVRTEIQRLLGNTTEAYQVLEGLDGANLYGYIATYGDVREALAQPMGADQSQALEASRRATTLEADNARLKAEVERLSTALKGRGSGPSTIGQDVRPVTSTITGRESDAELRRIARENPGALAFTNADFREV